MKHFYKQDNFIEQSIKAVFFTVLMSSIVTGCSDSNTADTLSGENATRTSLSKSFVVNGVSSKGPITGATIDIFSMDDNGNRTGAVLASTTTDNNGDWTVSFTTAPTEGVLIQSSGGSYIDEADPEPVFANKRRITLAATDIIEGVLPPGETTASVTILSNALLVKARRVAQSSTLNIQQALKSGQSVAKNALGFDPFTVQAANPLSPPVTANNESVLYGMYLGGIATALNSAAIIMGQPVPDFEMISAMVSDMSDGKLDGEMEGAVIALPVLGRNFPNNISLNLAIERFRNNNFAAYSVTAVGNQIAVVNEVQLALAPLVLAGDDQKVAGEAAVTLTASLFDSSGAVMPSTGTGAPTISWSQLGGSNVTLSGANTLTATFQSPVATAGTDQDLDFQISVTDSSGNSSTGQVRVIVTAGSINATPVISSAAPNTASEDVLYSYPAVATDADAADTLTWTLINQPTGMQVNSATGVVTWTPLEGVLTSGAVILTVTDNGTPVATASEPFTIAVTPVNDLPVGVADSFTTTEDTVGNITDAVLLSNDTDADTAAVLIVGTLTQPANGVVSKTATGVRYTPNANFFGTDTFRYLVNDGMANSAPVTVTVTVTGVNDVPVAVNDSVAGGENTVLTIFSTTLLANDTDIEVGNAGLSISGVTAASTQGGSVSLSGATITYTPAGNFFGTDTFTYTITDGGDTATAVVTVSVAEANNPPVAQDFPTETMAENTYFIIDVLTASSDPDGDARTITSPVTGTSIVTTNGGELSNENGFLIYSPADNFTGAEDVLTYSIQDTGGLSDSGSITVTVEADTDADGLSDIFELAIAPTPGNINSADSDGDTFSDFLEVQAGTDLQNVVDIPVLNATNTISIANGNNVITANTVWDAGNSPYHVIDPVTVQSGASLQILAGAVVKFAFNAGTKRGITVQSGGQLEIHGFRAVNARAMLLSDRDDSIAGDTNGDTTTTTAAANNWAGLIFDSGSNPSNIEGTEIRSATHGIQASDLDLNLSDVVISQVQNFGVEIIATAAAVNFSADGLTVSNTSSGHGLVLSAQNAQTINTSLLNITTNTVGDDGVHIRANTSGNVNAQLDTATLDASNFSGLVVNNNSNGVINAAFSDIHVNGTVNGSGMVFNSVSGPGNLSVTVDNSTAVNTITAVGTNGIGIDIIGANVNLSQINQSAELMGGGYGLSMRAGATASLDFINFSGSAGGSGLAGMFFDASIVSDPFPVEANITLGNWASPYELSGRSTLPPLTYPAIIKGAGLLENYVRVSGTFNGGVVVLPQLMPDLPAAAVWVFDGMVTFNNTVLSMTASTTPFVVKFFGPGSGLDFTNGGSLSALGDGGSNDVVFTSFLDDFGGNDTNNDGTGSFPSAGDWDGLRTTNDGAINLNFAQINFPAVGVDIRLDDGVNYSLSPSLGNVIINEALVNGVEIFTVNEFGANPVISPNFTSLTINNGGIAGHAAIRFEQTEASTINGSVTDTIINSHNGHGIQLIGGVSSILSTTFDTTSISNVGQSGVVISNTAGIGTGNFSPSFIDGGDDTGLSIITTGESAILIEGNPASSGNTTPAITFRYVSGSIGDDIISGISGNAVFEILSASPVIDRNGGGEFFINGGASHNIIMAANAGGSISNIEFGSGSLPLQNAALIFEDGSSTALSTVFLDLGHSRAFQLIGTVTSPVAFGSMYNSTPPSEILTIEGVLNAGGTLDANTPWEVSGPLFVPNGQILTVDPLTSPGTNVAFYPGAGITVNNGGTFNVLAVSDTGASLFTSTSDDNTADYAASSASEGDWEGIVFEQGALSTSWEDVDVRFANIGIQIVDNNSGLVFRDVEVARCNIGIELIAAGGNTNNAIFDGSVPGNQSAIRRCVNNHLLLSGSAGIFSNTISFMDIDGEGVSASNCLNLNNAVMSGSPISDSTFRLCGRGILLSGAANGIISNSLISKNNQRGVEVNDSASLDLQNSVVVSNTSPGNGAGVFLNSTNNHTINHNIIRHNNSALDGAGIYVETGSGTMTILNNLIAQNTADEGAGIYIAATNTVSVLNNTIVENQSTTGAIASSGPGLKVAGAGANVIDFNIFAENQDSTLALNDIFNLGGGSSTANRNYVNANQDPIGDSTGANNRQNVPLVGTGDIEFSGNWYLTQAQSGAVNNAIILASAAHGGSLSPLTTNPDGTAEGATNLDLGYHHPGAFIPADATNSTIEFAPGEPSPPFPISTPVTLIVTALDAASNPITGLRFITLFDPGVNENGVVEGSISAFQELGNGQYVFVYTTSASPDCDMLNVDIHGVTISATEFQINWGGACGLSL
jgi:hypothetical protein